VARYFDGGRDAEIWNPTNFRRTLGGLCLIVAPLLHFAAEHLISTGTNNGTASDWLANGVISDFWMKAVIALASSPGDPMTPTMRLTPASPNVLSATAARARATPM
jgi:hypothetical protein